jgi:hypothetical protein
LLLKCEITGKILKSFFGLVDGFIVSKMQNLQISSSLPLVIMSPNPGVVRDGMREGF